MTKQSDWEFAGALADILKGEINRHDMPRQEFESRYSGGIEHMRAARRAPAPRGELPRISDPAGFVSLCGLSMRAGVYLAIWAGSSGAIVFLDIFDGGSKCRFEATTDDELSSAIAAAAALLRSRGYS